MEEKKVSEAKSLDLIKLARVVLRKWIIVAVVGLISVIIGFVYSNFFITPLYSSSSIMLVDFRNSIHEDLSSEQINVAEQFVPTVAFIVKTKDVLQTVKEELELKESTSSLASRIQVQTMDDTFLIRITVRHPNPKAAYSIVKAVSKASTEYINQKITSGYITEIESPSVSSKPVSPNVLRYTLIAGLLGVFVSVFAIVIFSLFDNKVKSIEELQETVDLPILGVVPALSKNSGKGV